MESGKTSGKNRPEVILKNAVKDAQSAPFWIQNRLGYWRTELYVEGSPTQGGIIPHNRNVWKCVAHDLCKLLETGDMKNNKMHPNYTEKIQMDLIFFSIWYIVYT